MLVNEFSKDALDLGYAQFAIGIVLSKLNEPEAAKAVIAFEGSYVDGEKSVGEQEMLLRRRATIEEEIRKTGDNLISGLIKYLTDKKCLYRHDRSGRYKKVTAVSLRELLSDVSALSKVYREAMILLSDYGKLNLLVAYMDTDEYRETFKHDVLVKYNLSADGVRRNDLSDSIIAEIHADYKRFIQQNSCNGAYSPITGTPTAFLRNAFNAFFARGNSIQKILNTKGTNMDAGGESDMTLIDFHTIDAKEQQEQFDFIDVANRINRASYLMFSHNHNSVAFFDIFSCYREEKMKQRMQQNKRMLNTLLQGCSIEFEDSASVLNCGNLNTINNKKSSRIALCKIFSPIVDKGLSQKELYKYYKRAMQLTGETDNHDGRRLFTYVGADGVNSSTSHIENNSQMLQIIVNGHLALRELVNYLNRDDSIASIYNFPAIIFRNQEYLRRFQTIEEYVNYIQDVSPLVEEVRTDIKRSRDVVDGFYSNDIIWKYLGVNNLMNDNLFKKLASMPLSFIKSAVNNSETLSKDKELEHCFVHMSDKLKQVRKCINEWSCSGDLIACYKSLSEFYDDIIVGGWDEFDVLAKYSVVLSFYQTLKRTLTMEGKPLVDKDGFYLYESANVLNEMIAVSSSVGALCQKNEEFKKQYVLQAKQRALCCTQAYRFLLGETAEAVCNWQELREFFCACELLLAMLYRMYERGLKKVSDEVRQSINYAYLMVAYMAGDKELYGMPQVVSSCDDFSFIYRDGSVPEFYVGRQKSVEESMEINKKRNRVLVKVVNKFLAAFGDSYNVFPLSILLLNKYVPKRYTAVVSETDVDLVLHEAAKGIFGYRNSLKVDTKLKNWIKGIAECDSDGYVLNGDERCDLYDNHSYVLNSGFVVRLSLDRKSYTYSILSDEDRTQLYNKIALSI